MSRRNKHHLSAWQVYSDQLLLILGYFMIMATLLILVPHQKQSHDGIKPKAEYLVTLTYDDNRNVDLDLWLHHGDCTVYYNSRECRNISLDRDSRGAISNLVIDSRTGISTLSPNQEVIALRARMPGDYLTAVNYYNMEDSLVPIDCTIELVKLNPAVEIISTVHLHLDHVKQTLNAINFHVDEDGSVRLLPLPPEDLISLVQDQVHG